MDVIAARDERGRRGRQSRVVLSSRTFFGLLKPAEALENKGISRVLLGEQKVRPNPLGPNRPCFS
jgi:hypothetical protein